LTSSFIEYPYLLNIDTTSKKHIPVYDENNAMVIRELEMSSPS